MKTIVILSSLMLVSACLLTAGHQADQVKARQAAWKSSVSAEVSKDYETAISQMKSYAENGGDKYNASVRLGWLYYSKKNYGGAEKYYQSAAKLSRGAVTPLMGLVNTYKASKQTRKAIRACKSVLVLDKTNYTASMILAGMLYEGKDYRASGLIYAKVGKLYPEDLNAMSGVAWCMVYEGKKSRALPIFTRLVVMSPNYAYAQKGYTLCGGK